MATPQVKKSPSDFLKQVLGRPVIVKLNSGVTYQGEYRQQQIFAPPPNGTSPRTDRRGVARMCTGILVALDGYMNIAMEQTEEYVHGQLKGKYGDAFIRGNNVLYISSQPTHKRS
jgi:U6 snRNA-associated Sm-like protein LSm6